MYFPRFLPRLMNRFPRPSSLAWLALVMGAAWWIALLNGQRIARIERVGGQAPVAAVDAASPTGYARGTRGLLLPADSATSQAWIMDVQKMMATGAWRVTRADYDNAPEGRAVQGPIAYRWWLRLVAGMERQSGGLAVERASLHADPALHLLLCLGAGLLVAWRFGAAAGGLLALGVAALLAHAQVFAPGQPDSHGLFLATNLIALLLLLASWQAGSDRTTRLWLGAAGAAGGFGLWLDAGSQLVTLGALLTGGLAATWWESRKTGVPVRPLPWRVWAASGALVAIAGWLVDGRPGGIAGLNLRFNHPLLALAWIGAAEILVRLPAIVRGPAIRSAWIGLATGAALVLGPLVWLLYQGGTGGAEFGPAHPALASRGGLAGWLRADGLSIGLVAVLLPVLLVPAALRLVRGKTDLRPALVFALVSTVGLLLVGVVQLRWWGMVDVMLLGLLAVVTAAVPSGFAAIGWRSGLGLLLLPALLAAWPRSTSDDTLTPAEARALVERDLAQWLTERAEPGTIAFAPPALSASLCYYGGLRVVASPYRGNQDGLALAARIAGTPSADEAQALIQRRGIQYIVLSSWDDSLDQLAKLGSPTPERSLVALLRQWLPPRWLRPVAYQQPVIPGLEENSLAVFEVVEPQENAIALSRLAEYFVETGRLELAMAVTGSLEKAFASDAGAMIARAKVALARGDGRTLARIMPELLPAVAEGRSEDLPWERRANLAIVLAQTKHPDLARPEVAFCLAEADADRLRSLGPVSLYRLLTIARAFRVEFTDPKLRETALRLLPAEFQAQLGN
jgi:hypothetical protein